jgi:asparagine synthetase B (glutamine-hydrolysing)
MCSFIASSLLTLLVRLAAVNYHLKFRGPDHTGSAALGGFEFVHNLLHMTGSFTPQPFVSSDNATIALFNGEIYNFRQLQRVLRPDGPPYASDGQCILEAYQRWGSRFGRHFAGEFAVAVFDLRQHRITVVTDPFGVKPLFVAQTANAFGVSSYRSGLLRAGHDPESIQQLRANQLRTYSFEVSPGGAPRAFTLVRTHQVVEWDVHQHKQRGDDWEAAFEEAVRVRTVGAIRGVFLALSSGYDSGAIHLAMLRLGVAHATYSIVGAENRDDQRLLRQRVEYAEEAFRRRSSSDADGGAKTNLGSFIVTINASTYKRTRSLLQARCEPYRYALPVFSQPDLVAPDFVVGERLRTNGMPLLKDSAAMGVANICALAKARGQLTMLTGSGADETMTDYGFAGRRWAPQSQFGGHYPNDTALRQLFPWENFYEGSQRAYLAKDEYVTGAYGVEGRFPFLDAKVVQEQLYLAPNLKNTLYKAAAQLYMRKYGYPHEPCEASSEHPFGHGPGCKKVGFLVPARPRKVGAKSGCIGPACKPWF